MLDLIIYFDYNYKIQQGISARIAEVMSCITGKIVRLGSYGVVAYRGVMTGCHV